jgi:hypothetical protein
MYMLILSIYQFGNCVHTSASQYAVRWVLHSNGTNFHHLQSFCVSFLVVAMRCGIYLGWCLLLTLIITNKQVESSENEVDVSNDIEDPPPSLDDENTNNTCENPDHPECQPAESIPLISLEELAK